MTAIVPPAALSVPEGALKLGDLKAEPGMGDYRLKTLMQRAGVVPQVGPVGSRLVTPAQVRALRELQLADLDARLEEDDLLTLKEAARLLGVHASTLNRGLKFHGIATTWGRGQTGRKCRLVTLAELERYVALRTPPGAVDMAVRPRGWIGTRQAAARVGVPVRTFSDWIGKGRVEAACIKGRLYINPATLPVIAPPQPPHGWVKACHLHYWTYGVRRWMEERGYELRKFRVPGGSVSALYVSPEAAQSYRTYRQVRGLKGGAA